MSNLLKSKFFLGVVIVAVMAVGFVALGTSSTLAANCSITTTLRQGSTGAEVVCLQTSLGNLTADGNFGPMTKAAVVHWQSISGLTADGIFGPLSRAVWMSNAGNSANFPAGCVSATGFSSTTGLMCSGGVSNLPAGCSTTSGFSPTTGASCSVTTNLPAGCSTTSGFSPTTGAACSGGVNLPAGCTSTAGFSSTTGMSCSTVGTGTSNSTVAGNISSDSILGGFASTVVGVGDVNHQVAGFQLTGAGGGSNLTLNNLTIQLLETNNASSRLNDYFSSVSIWQNGKQVGSVPASAFSATSNSSVSHYVYSASIPLTGATVTAGQVSNFYIAVSANPSMDSGNFAANAWAIQVNNIRFTDGSGLTLVYNPASFTALVNAATLTGNSAAPNVAFFSFGSTATANNIVVNIGRSGSDQNSHVATVTQSSGTTQKVPLLLISVASQGGQAVSLNQIPVVFTNSADTVYKMTGEVYLMNGTTVLDSEAVGSGTTATGLPATNACNAANTVGCTITFKINPSSPFIVSTGSQTLTVAADINSITGGGYTAGDTLTVSTPLATTAYDITSGTPNGSELITAGNATTVIPGTANGQAVAFFATGLNLNVVSDTCTPATVQGGPSTLTCTISFSATANGAPMYIPQASSSVPNNASTVNFGAFISSSGTALVSGTPATRTISATYVQNGTVATNNTTEWIVPAGATANFTGTVVIDDTTNVNPGLYRAYLNDVRYGTGTGVWATDYTFNLGSINPATPGYTFVN